MPGRTTQRRFHGRPNEISAGGVLARPGNEGWEFALLRAGRHWGLPKGRLEAGETPAEAAVREMSEECSLSPETLTVVGDLPPSEYVYRRDGQLIFKLVHHFLVTAPEAAVLRPQQSEIDEAEWLALDAALSRASFADTRAALVAAAAALERIRA
jgi:8-oxo-dGTP pyrophosphatase MutT (NUDIX family)